MMWRKNEIETLHNITQIKCALQIDQRLSRKGETYDANRSRFMRQSLWSRNGEHFKILKKKPIQEKVGKYEYIKMKAFHSMKNTTGQGNG